MTNLRKPFFVLTLLLLLGLMAGAVSAETTVPATHDSYVDTLDRNANHDGDQLILSYSNLFDSFNSSSVAFIQFDLSNVNENAAFSALELDIADNQLEGATATLAIYTIDDDRWAEANITHNNMPDLADLGSPLQAISLTDAVSGTLTFGDTETPTQLGAAIESARTDDDIVSFVLQLTSATDGLIGALVLADAENGVAARIEVGTAAPTAIGYLVGSGSSDTLLRLGLLALGLMLLTVWGMRRRSFSRAAMLSGLLIVTALATFLPSGRASAAGCAAPAVPEIDILHTAGTVSLLWQADAASDGGFLIWRGVNQYHVDTTQPPHEVLPAGQIVFNEVLSAENDTYSYIVKATNSCGDQSEGSTPVGIRSFDVSTDRSTPISLPFSSDDPAIVDAQTLADHLSFSGGLAHMLSYLDPAIGAAATYFPQSQQGNNFALSEGSVPFVRTNDLFFDTAVMFGELTRIQYQLTNEHPNLISLPLTHAHLNNGAALHGAIPGVATIFRWDNPSGRFVVIAPQDIVRPGDPLGIIMAAGEPEPVVWPADVDMLNWAERPNAGRAGSKDLFLSWTTSDLSANGVDIYRRADAALPWTYRGTAKLAEGPVDMRAKLGDQLTNKLAAHLSAESTPLTDAALFTLIKNEPEVIEPYLDSFHELALVAARGFIDIGVADDIDWEYVITKEGDPPTIPATSIACIDSEPILKPLELGIVDTDEVPPTLGEPDSVAGIDGWERFNWDRAQALRRMDGRVLIDWNRPHTRLSESAVAFSDSCINEPDLTIVGYHVYRSAAGANSYALVSGETFVDTPILVKPSLDDTNDFSRAALQTDYVFEDVVKNPTQFDASVYGQSFDYRVCAVNRLGEEVLCEEEASVPVRDFAPPALATNVNAFVDNDETYVKWTYTPAPEASFPLTFYIQRSTELSKSFGAWEEMEAAGITVAGLENAVGPQDIVIANGYEQDLNQRYWYRVQVRDNAGNWSQFSAPAHATIFQSEGPVFPAFNNLSCSANELPLIIDGFADDVVQVLLYRAFEADGDYRLVRRFPVDANVVKITDSFVPAASLMMHYRLEAIDVYGNVSSAESYCAPLAGLNPPQPPPVTIAAPQSSTALFIISPDLELDELPEGTEAIVTPADGGEPIRVPVNPDGSFDLPAEERALYNAGRAYELEIVVVDAAGQSSDPTPQTVRLEPNLPDVDRPFYDLGPVFFHQWETFNGLDRLRIVLENDPCSPCVNQPLVLIYRRSDAANNWLQVSNIIDLEDEPGWGIIDDQDLDAHAEYEYRIVALDRQRMELIGQWETFTAAPMIAQELQPLSYRGAALTPDPVVPNCDYEGATPAAAALPNSFQLSSGWRIDVTEYWRATAANSCISSLLKATNISGYGSLIDADGTSHAIAFYQIGIGQGFGGLWFFNDGEIVVTVDFDVISAEKIPYTVETIQFTTSGHNADVTIRTGTPVKLTPSGGAGFRYSELELNVINLTSSWAFNSQTVPGLDLVDENLMWTFSPAELTIDDSGISMADGTLATPRFAFDDTTTRDDAPVYHNFGYGLFDYSTDSLMMGPDGRLHGAVVTAGNADRSYRTIFPADVVVGFNSAELSIGSSQILSGTLYDGSAALTYIDFLSFQTSIIEGDNGDGFGLSVLPDRNPNLPYSTKTIAMTGENNRLSIVFGGGISATVALGSQPTWGNTMQANGAEAVLFTARASSILPVQSDAWWRWDFGRFDIEPGINIIRDGDIADSLDNSCFSPATFDAETDFYIRRGGVSDGYSLPFPVPGILDRDGYSLDVLSLVQGFVDNGTKEISSTLTLNLPYPSNVQFTLYGDDTDSSNCVSGGTVAADVVTHQYWGYEQLAIRFDKAEDGGRYAQPGKSFYAMSGIAPIDGIGSAGSDADKTALAIRSVWLPDGDVGNMQVLGGSADFQVSAIPFGLTDIHLSPYRSTPLDKLSPPSLLGFDANELLADAPDYTGDGQFDAADLTACANAQVTNCGLTILDGVGGADYFGEFTNDTVVVAGDQPYVVKATSPVAILKLPGANRADDLALLKGFVNTPDLPWLWETVESEVNDIFPIKAAFKDKTGVIVAMKSDLDLGGIMHGDSAAIVTFEYDGLALEAVQEIGIYTGYAASQAGLRALAMYDGDYASFDAVEPKLNEWAEAFGYATGDAGPVGLSRQLWESWADKRFVDVYDVLEPTIKNYAAGDADDKFGVTSYAFGPVVEPLGAVMQQNLGTVLLTLRGEGVQLEHIKVGTRFIAKQADSTLFDIEWLTITFDKNGDFTLIGKNIESGLTDGLDTKSDVSLILGFGEGNKRFEGGVTLHGFEKHGIQFGELAGVLGLGEFGDEGLFYVGVRGSAEWESFGLGGTLLVGTLYSSTVMIEEGFGDALTIMLRDSSALTTTVNGAFFNLNGDFPLYKSAAIDAGGSGGISIWVRESANGEYQYGGRLEAAVYAEIISILSARGQLTMQIETLANNEMSAPLASITPRVTCNQDDGCLALSGEFYVAVGAGWCEPRKWKTGWDRRWWGDSWCYQGGAIVGLSYVSGGDPSWDANYDIDWE